MAKERLQVRFYSVEDNLLLARISAQNLEESSNTDVTAKTPQILKQYCLTHIFTSAAQKVIIISPNLSRNDAVNGQTKHFFCRT